MGGDDILGPMISHILWGAAEPSTVEETPSSGPEAPSLPYGSELFVVGPGQPTRALNELDSAGYATVRVTEGNPRWGLNRMLDSAGVAVVEGWEFHPDSRLYVAVAVAVGIPVRHFWDWVDALPLPHPSTR